MATAQLALPVGFTQHAFIEWLRTLPPDHVFLDRSGSWCRSCPIAAFLHTLYPEVSPNCIAVMGDIYCTYKNEHEDYADATIRGDYATLPTWAQKIIAWIDDSPAKNANPRAILTQFQ